MKSKDQNSRKQTLQKVPQHFRARDLSSIRMSRHRLNNLLHQGNVARVSRGLYQVTKASANEHETIQLVIKRIPKAIICLLTALRFYDIGTQNPRDVWIAIDRKARKPNINDLPIRTVRFSGQMLQYGVINKPSGGVSIKITSPARTVVDCFRYRNKVGIDVAIEALRESLRSRITTVDEILRAAEICRIRTILKPYLESLTS